MLISQVSSRICASFLLVCSLLLTAHAATTQRIAAGLSRPTFMTAPPGDQDRLFIVEQWTARIKIYHFSSGQVNPSAFLDINDRVIGTGNERGLLGLAFHPDFARNRWFFVYYINNSGNSVVSRFTASPTNPDTAFPSSEQIVLTIPQTTFDNHKAGMIAFRPGDGNLYIALGDGGDAGDPGNRAQSDTTLLGKLLRINVDSLPYTIPPSNPFAGNDGIRDEIWAKGLRNPWRFSFDRQTHALYIADVGQSAWEEVDYEPAGFAGGANYGWRLMEGNHCYNPSSNCDPGGLTRPIHEYDHTQGCAITGGYVYRGCAIPEFTGLYFFADYCSDSIWSFRYNGSTLAELTNRTAELAPSVGLSIGDISSFGEDAYGELYIADLLGGEIFKLVPSTLNDTNHNTIADECECTGGIVTDLVIQPVDAGLQLDWTAVARATCTVYRATVADAPFPGPLWTPLASNLGGTTRYVDTDGALERAFYHVTASCP
jgi:glucose/arabinose dehydrogenase